MRSLPPRSAQYRDARQVQPTDLIRYGLIRIVGRLPVSESWAILDKGALIKY